MSGRCSSQPLGLRRPEGVGRRVPPFGQQHALSSARGTIVYANDAGSMSFPKPLATSSADSGVFQAPTSDALFAAAQGASLGVAVGVRRVLANDVLRLLLELNIFPMI